jgi:hypothetical protein
MARGPQVLIAHFPLPRKAPDLGTVAAVNHTCAGAGTSWEDHSPLAARHSQTQVAQAVGVQRTVVRKWA